MAIDVPDFVKLDEQSDGVKMLVVQLGGRNISNETLGLRIQMLEKYVKAMQEKNEKIQIDFDITDNPKVTDTVGTELNSDESHGFNRLENFLKKFGSLVTRLRLGGTGIRGPGVVALGYDYIQLGCAEELDFSNMASVSYEDVLAVMLPLKNSTIYPLNGSLPLLLKLDRLGLDPNLLLGVWADDNMSCEVLSTPEELEKNKISRNRAKISGSSEKTTVMISLPNLFQQEKPQPVTPERKSPVSPKQTPEKMPKMQMPQMPLNLKAKAPPPVPQMEEVKLEEEPTDSPIEGTLPKAFRGKEQATFGAPPSILPNTFPVPPANPKRPEYSPPVDLLMQAASKSEVARKEIETIWQNSTSAKNWSRPNDKPAATASDSRSLYPSPPPKHRPKQPKDWKGVVAKPAGPAGPAVPLPPPTSPPRESGASSCYATPPWHSHRENSLKPVPKPMPRPEDKGAFAPPPLPPPPHAKSPVVQVLEQVSEKGQNKAAKEAANTMLEKFGTKPTSSEVRPVPSPQQKQVGPYPGSQAFESWEPEEDKAFESRWPSDQDKAWIKKEEEEAFESRWPSDQDKAWIKKEEEEAYENRWRSDQDKAWIKKEEEEAYEHRWRSDQDKAWIKKEEEEAWIKKEEEEDWIKKEEEEDWIKKEEEEDWIKKEEEEETSDWSSWNAWYWSDQGYQCKEEKESGWSGSKWKAYDEWQYDEDQAKTSQAYVKWEPEEDKAEVWIGKEEQEDWSSWKGDWHPDKTWNKWEDKEDWSNGWASQVEEKAWKTELAEESERKVSPPRLVENEIEEEDKLGDEEDEKREEKLGHYFNVLQKWEDAMRYRCNLDESNDEWTLLTDVQPDECRLRTRSSSDGSDAASEQVTAPGIYETVLEEEPQEEEPQEKEPQEEEPLDEEPLDEERALDEQDPDLVATRSRQIIQRARGEAPVEKGTKRARSPLPKEPDYPPPKMGRMERIERRPPKGPKRKGRNPKGSEMCRVEVRELLFSQKSVKETFQCGRSVAQLVDDLESGTVRLNAPFLRLTVFSTRDERRRKTELRCIDNRRLWALREYSKRINNPKLMINVNLFHEDTLTQVLRFVQNTDDTDGRDVRVRKNRNK